MSSKERLSISVEILAGRNFFLLFYHFKFHRTHTLPRSPNYSGNLSISRHIILFLTSLIVQNLVWDILQVGQALIRSAIGQSVARSLLACPFLAHCYPFLAQCCPFFAHCFPFSFFASTSAFQRCTHWLFSPLKFLTKFFSAPTLSARGGIIIIVVLLFCYCCCCCCCVPSDKSNSQLWVSGHQKSISPFSIGAAKLVPRARCRTQLRPSASARDQLTEAGRGTAA